MALALAAGCAHRHAIPPAHGAEAAAPAEAGAPAASTAAPPAPATVPAPGTADAAPPAAGGARPGAPPVPLTDPEPHAEPDLVGVTHLVKKGETIYRIARSYGLPVAELMEVNDLRDPRQLEVGAELFIPGATRRVEVPPLGEAPAEHEVAEPEQAAPPPPAAGGRGLRWPLKGVLYSRFGVRQGQRHDGIDIAAPEGSTIGAAAGGTVIYTGEQSGYGSIVIVRHDSPRVLTLYAHASAILVKTGEKVDPGQPIARVGHSGRTTGPHLHFEVRDGTRPRNPLFYLP